MDMGIALFPGTTKEMLLADYWLDRIADTERVLMNEMQIQDFNEQNLKALREDARLYDLSQLGNTIDKEDLLSIIAEMELPEEPLFLCKELVSDSIIHTMKENRNLDHIPQHNKIRYGITTGRGDIRIMPTELSLNSAPDDIDTDQLQSSAILINEPVAVLHESLDGQWYFIRCSYYDGWVLKSCIGLCEDYKELERATTMNQFIVVTANRLVLPYNPKKPCVSMLQLTMGTRVEIDETVTDDYNNYAVKLPVRCENGCVKYETASIPVSSDVSAGYMKYTTRNVLTLAFKTLGDLYGWGGSYQSRDCSSLPFDLYRCFGFQLPRDSANLGKIIKCISYTNLAYHSAAERKEIFRQIRPGAIIGWPGHTMMYLGNVDGCCYVINYAGHLTLESKEGKRTRYQVNICLINSLGALRDNGMTWLESLTYIKSLEIV